MHILKQNRQRIGLLVSSLIGIALIGSLAFYKEGDHPLLKQEGVCKGGELLNDTMMFVKSYPAERVWTMETRANKRYKGTVPARIQLSTGMIGESSGYTNPPSYYLDNFLGYEDGIWAAPTEEDKGLAYTEIVGKINTGTRGAPHWISLPLRREEAIPPVPLEFCKETTKSLEGITDPNQITSLNLLQSEITALSESINMYVRPAAERK